MFSKDSILYEVNITTKLLSFIFVLVSVIFCNNIYVLLGLSLILFIISSRFTYLRIFNFLISVLSIVMIFYPQYLWMLKILLLFSYFILFNKTIKLKDLRYLLEISLYRYQSKKVTYTFLYSIYFVIYYKHNLKKLLRLKDNYGFKSTIGSYLFILRMSYKRTKEEIKELIIVNNLRFYNYSKKRTYLEKPKWEIWDTCYFLIHFFLCATIVIISLWR